MTRILTGQAARRPITNQSRIDFWPYQSRLVTDLLSTDDDVLVEYPTGSGKTAIIVATASRRLDDNPDAKVLIATTQDHIAEAFLSHAASYHLGRRVIRVPPDRFQPPPDADGVIAGLRTYLHSTRPGFAVVCTHAAATGLKPPTGIPADLRGCWLFVDEAHHAAALGLSQFVTAWRRAGGRAMFFTATGYRYDELAVQLPGMRLERRTLAEHMQAGYAPKRIVQAVSPVLGNSRVPYEQMLGDDYPPQAMWRVFVQAMRAQWQADGKPKTILRLPILQGGSQRFVQMVETAFKNAGARVLNATGENSYDQRRIREALVAERRRERLRQSRFDVVIGIQRVVEGFDWPWCSHVYTVGLLRSVTQRAQLLGRATRLKPDDYRRRHRNVACLRMFVPCSAAAADTLAEQHARSVMLVCAHIQDSNAAYAWLRCLRDSAALSLYIGREAEEGERTPGYRDPRLVREAEAALLANRRLFVERTGREPSDNELLQQMEVSGFIGSDGTNYPVDQAVVRMVLLTPRLQAGGRASDLERELTRRVRTNPVDTPQELNRLFEELLEQFGHDNAGQEGVRQFYKQVFDLTGSDIESIARSLFESRRVTPAWVAQEARHFRNTHRDFSGRGIWPAASLDQVHGWHDTWARIDTIIKKGTHGWGEQNRLRGGLREFLNSLADDDA